ncbi:MAG: HNH endonuclease [Acidobacteria bacterium]|nr:HNH endonuclease [Acidobacteriota bacterium]
MPTTPLRPCLRHGCPRLVTSGLCKEHARAAEARRGSAWQRGYDDAWRALRLHVLAGNPLCQDCMAVGRVTAAEEVHHLVAITTDPGRRLDPTNLVPLCHTCHSRRTRATICTLYAGPRACVNPSHSPQETVCTISATGRKFRVLFIYRGTLREGVKVC